MERDPDPDSAKESPEQLDVSEVNVKVAFDDNFLQTRQLQQTCFDRTEALNPFPVKIKAETSERDCHEEQLQYLMNQDVQIGCKAERSEPQDQPAVFLEVEPCCVEEPPLKKYPGTGNAAEKLGNSLRFPVSAIKVEMTSVEEHLQPQIQAACNSGHQCEGMHHIEVKVEPDSETMQSNSFATLELNVKSDHDVAEGEVQSSVQKSEEHSLPSEMDQPNLFKALLAADGGNARLDLLQQVERTASTEPDVALSGDDCTSEEEAPAPADGDTPSELSDQSEEEDQQIDTVPNVVSCIQTAKDGTQWGKLPNEIKSKTPSQNIFKGPPRQLPGCQNINRPLDAFGLFISDKILSDVIKYTNIEGLRVLKEKWVAMDMVECQGLLGLLLFLGTRKQSMLKSESIWDSVYGTGIVRACMSRRRFQVLLTYMRFDDKSTRTARRQRDPFAPFRDTWEEFMKGLTRHYVPGPLLTIGEQFVPFRGRCGFLQYLPSKPDRYGLQIFWVADAENNFPLLGIPYLGRPVGQDREVNLGRKIALDLATPFFKSGRNVTCDNFFTDLTLAETLLKNGLTLVGTVRGNKRFLPDSFKSGKKLALYDSEFMFSGETTLVNYQSKRRKNVVVLSSMHDTGVVDQTASNSKKIPEMVLFYNKTKGAVETLDKMAHVYTVKRRTQRWPMVMFTNIVDLATIAARTIWEIRFPQHSLSQDGGHAAFIQAVSEELILPQVKRRLTSVVMPRSLHELAEKVTGSLQEKLAASNTEVGTKSQKAKLPVTGQKRAASHQQDCTAGEGKRKRCLFCHWKVDRKTQFRCCRCCEFICPDHTYKVCPSCIKAITTCQDSAS